MIRSLVVVALCALMLSGFVSSAQAVVTLLDAPVTNPTTNAGTSPTTHNYTAPAGTDRVVVVYVSTEQVATISGVTIGGTPATQAGVEYSDGTNHEISAYYLPIGDSGTPQAMNVVATFSASASRDHTVFAATYSGVIQDDSSTGAGFTVRSVDGGASAAAGTINMNITNETDGRVIAFYQDNTSVSAPTSGTWTFTEHVNFAGTSNTSGFSDSDTVAGTDTVSVAIGARGAAVAFALNPVPSCIPTGSLSITPAQSLNGNPIDLTTISSATNATNVVYTVTDGAAGAPFEELEYFDTADDVCDYSNWTNSAESTGNCGGTFDPGTTGGFLYVYNSAVTGSAPTLTPSGNTGPTSLDSGTSPPGGFLFLENSGAPPFADSFFTRNAAFDATNYEAHISFASAQYMLNEGGGLRFQVDDGGGWVTEWEQINDDGNNGAWTQVDINLFAGTVSIDGGADVPTSTYGGSDTAYTSGNLQYRFVFVSGTTFQNDVGLDTIRVYGPSRGTTYYDSSVDGPATSVDTTGWPSPSTLTLTITGDDATCSTPLTQAQDTFDFTACTENQSITLDAIPATITGPTVISASDGGGGGTANFEVRWREDGGAWSAWFPNGSTYTPSGPCLAGTVEFQAQADGDCGKVTDASAVLAYDTTDQDVATLTISAPSGNVAGTSVAVLAQVGVEGNPDSMNNMTVTIAGSSACNVAGAAMSWNGSFWQYDWDTSACGTVTPETGVTIDVSGDDPDCGDTVSASQVSVTIDNTIPNSTSAGLPTATSKFESIDVQVPYFDDGNGDNTVLIEWGLEGVDFSLGSQALLHASSPYTYTIPTLVNGTAYQVQITLTDPDGAAGGGWSGGPNDIIYVINNIIPTNPMLHNAASTGSSKWGGSWGIGGKYGTFTCDTCHVENDGTNTNIKRVRQVITIPGDAAAADRWPNNVAADTVNVVFTDATDGSSDFASSTINHGGLDPANVCEACHTYDPTQVNGVRHHGWDMSGASASDADHFAGLDCMTCHNHKQGFAATACDSCHGDPPTTNDNDGSTSTGLTHTPVTTGSVTAGAHDRHVNVEGFVCEACHSGYTMPNGGDIDVSFNVFGSTSGSYTGQSGVSYNGGTPGTGTLTCNATYCHGSATLSAPTAPVWNGAVNCGDCHGASQGTPPSSVSHATHVGSLGRDCSDCHGAGYTAGVSAPVGHVDANVHIDVSAAPNTGTTATYDGASTQDYPGLAPANTDATCANISCHFGSTPNWDTAGATNCASCHNNGAGEPWPATGAHEAHFTALGISLSASVNDGTAVRTGGCDYCHTGTSGSHADGTADVAISGTFQDMSGGAMVYNGTNCTNVSCHGGIQTPSSWAAGTLDVNTQCTQCHKYEATATEYNSATSGMHGITTTVSGRQHIADSTNVDIGCLDCHNGPPASHFGSSLLDTALDALVAGDFNLGVSLNGAGPDDDTCAFACHSDGGDWARVNNKTAAQASDGSECNNCHGVFGTFVTGFSPNHTRAGMTSTGNHSVCKTCHGFSAGDVDAGYNATWRGASDVTHVGHGDEHITMNGPVGTGAGYDAATWTCTNTCHSLPEVPNQQLADSAWPLNYGDFGAGSCDACHAPGGSGPTVVWPAGNSGFNGDAYGAHLRLTAGENLAAVTDWTAQCSGCHGFHSGDSGLIPNPPSSWDNPGTVAVETTDMAAALGINYSSHGGIYIGGTANDDGTGNPKFTTEAEICWDCHAAQGISEWGTNNTIDSNADGTPDWSISYNYGTLTGSTNGSWIGATWNSPTFSYKNGNIQSTHSANIGGTWTAAVSGANYAKSETTDAVGNIRCTYCHDVHNTGPGPVGKPYLRGTWKGNPYNEDGAPRNGAAGSWTTNNISGQVPRASTSPTNSTTKGGYWIDQNSNDPNSTDTLAGTAGLCTTCHGTDVDNMDMVTGENLWVSGGNGHLNAVIGGTGTNATANNIFSIAKRGSNQVWDDNGNSNYYMSMGGWTPQMARRAFGYRGDQGNIRKSPLMNGEHRFFNQFLWDNPPAGQALQVDDYQMVGNSTTAVGPITQSQYHTFNCGKCHNPHASRLPKLMITNCLDTAQNTWDENAYGAGNAVSGAPAPWTGTHLSQWPSAQNCHRLADDHSTTSRGAGWNVVTPW